jgi:hypothetical protein
MEPLHCTIEAHLQSAIAFGLSAALFALTGKRARRLPLASTQWT